MKSKEELVNLELFLTMSRGFYMNFVKQQSSIDSASENTSKILTIFVRDLSKEINSEVLSSRQ